LSYDAVVGFPLPISLSPSKVESFISCPLAFRFSAVDRLPDPPSVASARGSLVHRALELLFCAPAGERTPGTARRCLDEAVAELQTSADWAWLALDAEAEAGFLAEAEAMVGRYFSLEDPRSVREIGLELRLEVEVGGVTLRGIIDRLELDGDGELVVTDYKTGRPPSERHEQARLSGVHFYAYLCERLFGRRPSRIQLLYLGEPMAIVARPTEQSIRYLPKRAGALWSAIERACSNGQFRERPSGLCDYCAYKAWCPAYGGDPARAQEEAPVVFGLAGRDGPSRRTTVPSAA